ncbi:hypothetical protein [Streptomyces sp. NPDC046942]|uniref:hypothetical protein n=1 Tax=Streptomyces sp. NPDC046942 TaxID=3155137 RepID=UPI0033C6D9E8
MREETGVELSTVPKLIGIHHRADAEGTAIRLSHEHEDHSFVAPDALAGLLPSAHTGTLKVLDAARTQR